MMNLICLITGAVIGWNLPQPIWAKEFQSKITTWWSTIKIIK